MKEYVLYKGDDILAIGTAREIADKLGIGIKTVWHYGTPRYAKRTSEKNGRRLVEA